MLTLSNFIGQKVNNLLYKFYLVKDRNKLKTFQIEDSVQIDYPLDSAVGRQLFFGKFEVDEIEFLKSVIRPGDTVLDIGANAGIYSVITSRIVGETGHIYAFEIGPSEIKMFRHNITKNNVKNVTLIEYAISNQTGQAKFAISHDGAMNSLAKNDHPEQSISEWLTVETITLNDAAKKYNIDKVDIIKMDVEGAEKLVFEGGLEVLLRWKPRYILFESSDLTSTAFGYSVTNFIQYLYQNKFKVYAFEGATLIPLSSNGEHDPNQYNFVAIPI